MNTKVLVAVAINMLFVAILLIWPLINSPEFTVSIEDNVVPLGGELNFTASFPSVPAGVSVEVIDPVLNETVYSAELTPSKQVRASIPIEEGKFRIGFHVLRIRAILDGRNLTEETYFSVFGATPISLRLEAEKRNITLSLIEGNYTEVSQRVYAEVRSEKGPVENVTLLAISLGPNSTITEVARTDAQGRAVLTWRANVTGNSSYRIVVQAIKPGHPLASGEVEIEVIVRRGD